MGWDGQGGSVTRGDADVIRRRGGGGDGHEMHRRSKGQAQRRRSSSGSGTSTAWSARLARCFATEAVTRTRKTRPLVPSTPSARAKHGLYPRLGNRNDLWPLLLPITKRKALDQIVRRRRAKRWGWPGG